jgi:RNA polymerase sigma-70 factor (ECF subfamily)
MDVEKPILAALQRGDRSAFNTLASHYWPSLVGYAADLTGSLDQGQDLVQDALLALWQRRGHFAGGSVRSYLMKAIRSRAMNLHRGLEIRRRPSVHAEARASIHGSKPPRPDLELEENELARAIEEALRALPERPREALVLVRFQGLSHAEAAAIMGTSNQTVANHVSSALKQLRDLLEVHLDPPRRSDREGREGP